MLLDVLNTSTKFEVHMAFYLKVMAHFLYDNTIL